MSPSRTTSILLATLCIGFGVIRGFAPAICRAMVEHCGRAHRLERRADNTLKGVCGMSGRAVFFLLGQFLLGSVPNGEVPLNQKGLANALLIGSALLCAIGLLRVWFLRRSDAVAPLAGVCAISRWPPTYVAACWTPWPRLPRPRPGALASGSGAEEARPPITQQERLETG